MSDFNCWFLSCIQVSQEAGKVVWYSHLLKNFPQFVVINTVKDFGIVNKAEVDFFSGTLLIFQWSKWCWHLISGSSAFSKTSLKIWSFLVHILLRPSMKAFEHDLDRMWNKYKCMVVWTFFGIVLLWDWNENWPFESCGHYWIFQIFWHVEYSTFTASSFRIWNSSAGIPSLSLAFL